MQKHDVLADRLYNQSMGRARGRGQASAAMPTRASIAADAAQMAAAGMYVGTFAIRKMSSEESAELRALMRETAAIAPGVEITFDEDARPRLFGRARKQVVITIVGPQAQAQVI